MDQDYIRKEIAFVNYVRDRKQADVHVLISRRATATNGDEYTVEFIGQRIFAAMDDTLTYVTQESDSQDERRLAMVKALKLGLVRYLARTPLAEDLTVSYNRPTRTEEPHDPWNNWWFTLRGHTYFNGEKSYRRVNAWGSAEAQRVTEDVKFKARVYGNYNESKFDYEDYQALVVNRGQGANASIYFSLGDHWSWGMSTNVFMSEYSNHEKAFSLGPGLEYNIFPYDESTHRRLSFTYRIMGNYADYFEETIFGKTEEALYYQSLRAQLELIRPWGSIRTTVRGSHYLHNIDKNHLSIYSNLSLNLFQGLSFELSGGYSRVHDQLSLRAGEASQEDLLLRQQEIETSYSYWSSVGLSYAFGSQYNNIVNPRF